MDKSIVKNGRIALLGATGTIGRHVAAGLAERGLEAVALVRDPGRARLPVRAVAADLRHPESLRSALAGADQLFLLTPHDPDQDALEAAAVEAAVAAGLRRIVKISGGAPSLGPQGPTRSAVAHWRSERRIEESGLGFCFLRPSFLMQNLLTQVAPTVSKTGILAAPMGRKPIAMVDARDVADCAVAALADPDGPNQAWHLTGPRAVSFTEIARILGVPYLNLSPRAAARALRNRGASTFEVEHALRMGVYFAAGADTQVTDAVASLTGHPARSIEDFLAEHAGAFAGRRWPGLARLVPSIPSPGGL
jgi:NAD(P)H dehydrogenase (quinone)